ncbi:hypothetical protein DBZ36_10405 [Alginatibacterium sediminis]|uniref:Uncharacterized protein n=1 Tax=Alginatibacterium sediminis TaxID=2164068 RepID=A0A420EDP0_9ALTE|nr:DUF6635 family protein [Alginatibacterium sediminis]RKF18795.1 hypothetical protein DBZ36_10405 [Alginatibacterium sediminis]
MPPSVSSFNQAEFENLLWDSIGSGAQDYFRDCHQRVDSFVTQNFQYPGAFHLNRLAIGWDLIKAPLNLFWAPFYLLFMLMAWIAKKLGFKTIALALQKIPSGFSTRVQLFLEQQCYQQLLQRPIKPGDKDGLRDAIENRLRMAMSASDYAVVGPSLEQQIRPLLDEAINHYTLSRTASADISNSMLSMVIGVFAFQKYTPGGIALGLYGAGWLAKWIAIDEFWAGPWLGQLYYTVFDASPSIWVSMGSITISIVFFAVVACFSGLIIDPLQARLGIHQWRLRRMLVKLEQDFKRKSRSSFRPKEPYIARILDILDIARIHLS